MMFFPSWMGSRIELCQFLGIFYLHSPFQVLNIMHLVYIHILYSLYRTTAIEKSL